MRPINRITPVGPASAYKTYEVARPVNTHFRDARCEEVDCKAYQHGWKTLVDVSTTLGQKQARYINDHSGRHFKIERTGPKQYAFVFPPGQQCFKQHRLPVGKPPIFLLRGGDFRGNPMKLPTLKFKTPQAWIDDFGEHQERLADRLKRG